MIHKLDVIIVDSQTPELCQIVIDSFSKFLTKDFDIRFLFVENSSFDLLNSIDNRGINIHVVNNPTEKVYSHAHGSGLEFAKSHIREDANYVFTCHNDVCVTSSSFFEELKDCIESNVALAGVCEDKVEERVKALHCSGLLAKTEIYKKVSLLPSLPRIDTADLLTIYCRENGLLTKLFQNTYNDERLVDNCNSPFKELGKNCGVDRCLDSLGKVMFIHQGRGTSKYFGDYSNNKKIMTSAWINFCKPYCE